MLRLLRMNTEGISVKFEGGNHYHVLNEDVM